MLSDALLIRYMFILLILDTVSCSMGAVLLSGDIKSTWLYFSTSQQLFPLINSPAEKDESKISAKNVECLIFATCMFMGISLPIYTFVACVLSAYLSDVLLTLFLLMLAAVSIVHPGIVLLLMMCSLYDTSVFNC